MGILDSLFGGPSVEALKKKRDLEGLWKLREHKDWSVRRDAAVALAEFGDDRGVRYLLAAVHAADTEVTAALVRALARQPQLAGATVRLAQAGGYGHAAERVMAALNAHRDRLSPDSLIDDLLNSKEGPLWWSRRDLRRILLPFGPRVIKHLNDKLEDPQKARRAAQLAGALGRAAGGTAPAMIEAFRENPAVRPEVEAALLELYDGGLDALGAALEDNDDDIRALAAGVLAKLARHSRERVEEAPHSDQSEAAIRGRVRGACAEGLERARNDPSEVVRRAAGVK
jgi:HEAT repeat protein